MTDVPTRKDMSVVLAVCAPSQPKLEAGLSTPQTAPLASAPLVVSSESTNANLTGSSPQKPGVPVAHRGVGGAVRDILARGGYGNVEVGYCRNERPSLEEAVERAITNGARQIVVVPTVVSLFESPPCECFVEDSPNSLAKRVAQMQAQYPSSKIVYAAPPFDYERLVDLVLSKIREFEPPTFKAGVTQLNDLRAGETGVVRELDGGSHFRSRMASLGFTPGAMVKMMQNYGHGAVIVSLRGTRVALGRGEARKVGVARRVGDRYPVL
jgi:ferrous iron transport protein A